MKGPELKLTDPSGPGMAPPKLKSWLRNVPEDDKRIVDWVIQNFQPLDGSQGGQTLDLEVCIGGVTKTVTFVISQGPH